MKAKNIILILICSLTSLLLSCSESLPYTEDAYKNTWIDVYPSYISLDEDEFTGEFSVNSSGNWYIYDSPSWINLSTYSGYNYDYVSFTVDDNTESTSRYGYIKIRTEDGFTKETEIEISQPPTIPFEVSMPHPNFKAAGDWWTLYIKASSSRSWTITKSDTWVHLGSSSNTYSTYSGKGEENVYIYVDKNTYSWSRSSVLTIKCGTQSKSITITQDGTSSKAPFVINSIEIGNTDNNGNIINNYGTTIYSSQTRYLTPKLYLTVNTPGTYTIYAKMFDPNGKLRSKANPPSGYSWSDDITIYSYTTSKELSGWGSNTAGYWQAGQYKWEFYYNSEKIAEKKFNIY